MNRQVLQSKRLFLLDMDGTIYIDNVLFPKSLEFLRYVREKGGKHVFLTNNSSKNVEDYIKKLTAMGIVADASNFLTSSQATAWYLEQNYGENRVYVLGTASLKAELKVRGIKVQDEYRPGEVDVLLVGFDTELHYGKLVDACRMLLTEDVVYMATNPDWVCPTAFGAIPDCGSICEMLERATGRKPKFIGKPEPTMVELALAATGFSREETLMVGDRLYTDIACGMNAGVATALVLSGEAKQEDLAGSPYRPDFVFRDIGELLEAIKTEK